MGKERAAPPTLSLPHPHPTGSAKAPTAVDKGSAANTHHLSTLSWSHKQREATRSRGQRELRNTHRIFIRHDHTASQKVTTLVGKGRAATPTISVTWHGPTSNWKEHAAMDNLTSATPLVPFTGRLTQVSHFTHRYPQHCQLLVDTGLGTGTCLQCQRCERSPSENSTSVCLPQ